MPRKASTESAASPTPPCTPWRERPLLPLKTAAEIAGVSPASLYRFGDEGRLKLRRLAGRTLVETASLVDLLHSAEAWTPSSHGKEARAKRGRLEP